ncbi:ATP14 [Candida pseudojiufengensis]|uniref:ATP14 n=1 Tax=Candida pseudojiufengensis TaxID=497109 RepID=UPI0022253B64|nr:ATP14 [Candida pseudojiufengensis]KAI5966399.1 ATP14 [Candida pseudojiufengensis]
MFRPIARICSKRLLSATPKRSNLIGDLYVQNIRQFKPKALTQEEIDSAVKRFQLPGKPTIPQIHELSSENVKEYETSDVNTAAYDNEKVDTTENTKPDNDDWFVLDDVEETAH